MLVVADWNYILENPSLPSLYDIAPKYILKVRPAGLDAWQDIPQTLALGSGDCFAEGTPITMESGEQLPIEKISIGMRVRTRGERVHTVTNQGLMALNAPTFELTTKRGGRAILTGKHRVWTSNREWVALRELRDEDTLIELDEVGNQKSAEIASIKPAGRRNVYDVTVEDVHEVFAGNLLTAQCKDFACWRVAELRNQGYDDVFPHIKVSYHDDPKGIEPAMTVYHIQVRVHDIIEDPSAILGMPTNVTYEQLRGGEDPSAIAQQQIAAGMFTQTSGGLYVPSYDQAAGYGYGY